MSIRDQIEEIVRGAECRDRGYGPDVVNPDAIADAILAALPDMIAPLVWEESTSKKHSGCIEYAETRAGTYFICYDSDDFTGFYCDFVYLGNCTWFGSGGANSREIASHHHDDDLTGLKTAANTHHRAAIMAAFTGETP
jgi:hypothetical protein